MIIPKTFRVSVVAAVGLLACLSIVTFMTQSADFALQTSVVGIFSITLLCVYVVYISLMMRRMRCATPDMEPQKRATTIANRIQIASLIKMFILATVLIGLVVGLKFNAFASILGVSVIYLPLLIVPFFVKFSTSDDPDSPPPTDDSPKESQI